MLTPDERKSRLPFGAQQRAAEEHGVVKQTVSAVMKGTLRHEGVENSLVRMMNEQARALAKATGAPAPEKLSRVAVFGPVITSMRRARALVGKAS